MELKQQQWHFTDKEVWNLWIPITKHSIAISIQVKFPFGWSFYFNTGLNNTPKLLILFSDYAMNVKVKKKRKKFQYNEFTVCNFLNWLSMIFIEFFTIVFSTTWIILTELARNAFVLPIGNMSWLQKFSVLNCMVVKMWTELWPQRGKKPLSNYRYKIDKPDISCIWCKINIILSHIMILFVGNNLVIIQELR